MKKLSASLLSLLVVSIASVPPGFSAQRASDSRVEILRRSGPANARIAGDLQEVPTDLSDALAPTALDAATELQDDPAPLYMQPSPEYAVNGGQRAVKLRSDSRSASPAADSSRVRSDLSQLAMNPAAAPQMFDNAMAIGQGIRPGGAHPFPEIGHDPRPEIQKFDSAFPLRINPASRRGQQLLSRNLNAEVYPAWNQGPAGSVVLPGNPRDEESVRVALERFMADHPSLLQGLTPNDFAYSVNRIEGKEGVADMIYANFAQIHNDLLVEGAELQFKVKLFADRAVLLPVEGQAHGNLRLNTDGTLGPDQINAAVRQRLGISPNDWRTVEKVPYDRRVMRAGGQWRVMDVFMVPAKQTMVGVDVNTGESFAWDPRVNAGVETAAAEAIDTPGTVGGMGVKGYGPNIPGAEIVELPLGYNEITTSAGTVYADKDGKFVVPGRSGEMVQISATLKGKTYEIRDKAVTQQMTVTTSALAGTKLQLVFPASGSDENSYAAAMLAYTINLTHDAAEAVLGKDIIGKTIGNANLNQTCNAHYEPWGENSVNGYKASSQCVNSSYVSVMAHEVGHKIHDYARKKFIRKVVTIQGTVEQHFTSLHIIDNAGLSEGHGDTYTHLVTRDPRVGVGFLKGQTRGEIRNAEDPPHQYQPNEEPHEGGKPWEEFEWELGKELIKLYGPEKGWALKNSLIYPVIFAAKDVPDAIDNVILRDMQADGTVPHFDLMAAIAGKRNIHPKNPGHAAQTAQALRAKFAGLDLRFQVRSNRSIGERFLSIPGAKSVSIDHQSLIVTFDTRANLRKARRSGKLPKTVSGMTVRYEAARSRS